MKFLIIITILISVVFLGFFVWREIYLPKDAEIVEDKLFLVEQGQTVHQIAQKLEEENLIKNSFYFKAYVWLKGKSKELQAGKYLLNPSMNLAQIVEKFIFGDVVKTKITIPEGFTVKQIEQRINQQTDSTTTDFSTLTIGDFKKDFEFLKDVPDQTNLEGFLFPDTYYFLDRETSRKIAGQMLRNFDERLTPELRKEIAIQKKSIFEIVILASLIEKEVRTIEDKKIVSGIFWKRLENNIPLQSCATITYLTGKKTTIISTEETKIDSPYNTYKYLGLPPGPVCNPGLESILAAIYPQRSEFWYFLSASDGETIFSKTLLEHNSAKAKYL